MILCVDSKVLKTSNEVQRAINLEDIVTNHTKYYDNEEEALKDSYVPLEFSVCVRSMSSNLVLQIDKENEGKRYYVNLAKVQEIMHKGYDLIMYLSSIAVLHSVEYSLEVDNIMLKHSQFSPIGILNIDPSVINPIVCVHIILSDEGAEEMKSHLKGDRKFVPISEMCEEGNLKALLDTIIEVKEEATNE